MYSITYAPEAKEGLDEDDVKYKIVFRARHYLFI